VTELVVVRVTNAQRDPIFGVRLSTQHLIEKAKAKRYVARINAGKMRDPWGKPWSKCTAVIETPRLASSGERVYVRRKNMAAKRTKGRPLHRR